MMLNKPNKPNNKKSRYFLISFTPQPYNSMGIFIINKDFDIMTFLVLPRSKIHYKLCE